jgi:hypothetical protein
MAAEDVNMNTGKAPVKQLGQTRGTRFGTNRDAQASSTAVSEEKAGS